MAYHWECDETAEEYYRDALVRCAHCGAETTDDAAECCECDEAICEDCVNEGRGCATEQEA